MSEMLSSRKKKKRSKLFCMISGAESEGGLRKQTQCIVRILVSINTKKGAGAPCTAGERLSLRNSLAGASGDP